MKADTQDPEEAGGTGSPPGVQILSLLCGLVMAYLGFKSATQDYRRVDKLIHLSRFVETPGKILQSSVRRDSSGAAGAYYPDMLYEYFVEGKSIWGWRLSYEEESRSKTYWEKRLTGYAVGSLAAVYYDPQNPKESILEKKTDRLFRALLYLALGGACFLIGCLLVWLPLADWVKRGFFKK